MGKRLDACDRVANISKSKLYHFNGAITVERRCSACETFRPIEEFEIRGHKYKAMCLICRNDNARERNWKAGRNKRRNYRKFKRDKDGILQYRCSKCGEYKYEMDFSKTNNNSEFGLHSWCSKCLYKKQMEKYKKQMEK